MSRRDGGLEAVKSKRAWSICVGGILLWGGCDIYMGLQRNEKSKSKAFWTNTRRNTRETWIATAIECCITGIDDRLRPPPESNSPYPNTPWAMRGSSVPLSYWGQRVFRPFLDGFEELRPPIAWGAWWERGKRAGGRRGGDQ